MAACNKSKTLHFLSLIWIVVTIYPFTFWFTRPKLKEEMEYCNTHPEEISKLAKVKARLHDLKGVMVETIDKVWLFTAVYNIIKIVGIRMLNSAFV